MMHYDKADTARSAGTRAARGMINHSFIQGVMVFRRHPASVLGRLWLAAITPVERTASDQQLIANRRLPTLRQRY